METKLISGGINQFVQILHGIIKTNSLVNFLNRLIRWNGMNIKYFDFHRAFCKASHDMSMDKVSLLIPLWVGREHLCFNIFLPDI